MTGSRRVKGVAARMALGFSAFRKKASAFRARAVASRVRATGLVRDRALRITLGIDRLRALLARRRYELASWQRSVRARLRSLLHDDGPAFLREHIPALLREHVAASIVLFVGIAVSVGGFVTVRQYEQAADRQEFDRKAAHFILVSRNTIDRYIETITATGALIAESGGGVNRWEFLAFAEERLPAHPGMQALAWAPRIPVTQLAAYEKSARDDGLFSFRLTERDVEGQLVSVGARPEYWPIYYVEPHKGNGRILGIDLSFNPAYRAALERARDGGRMSAVFAEAAEAPGTAESALLVIAPVYESEEMPDSVASRREALSGFVIGLLDIGMVIDNTIEMFTTPDWLDIYLLDEQARADRHLLHYRPSLLGAPDSKPIADDAIHNGLFASAPLELADRNWSIVVKPVAGKLVAGSGVAPWGVGLVSLLLTLALVAKITSAQNYQQMIERAVDERTAELLRATKSNWALEREIEHRTRVEAELRAAKEQADVANRAKSDFLAMVSHELRTPLNAIIGFSEMTVYEIFGPVGDKKYQQYGRDIRNSGMHLLGLINNILDLAKVEANQFELHEADVDIVPVIEEALTLLRDKAAEAGIRIETKIDDPLPFIRGDARPLKQILINLLSNAVKFTDRDGDVAVGARIDYKGRFLLTVSDTGTGISKADQAKIFQPFTQLDSSLARKYEGTGLGLPLTKSLVELHDGELKLKSKPAVGTTITVLIPAARVVPRRMAAE